ncbi:MAG: (Fe-S)-binding protein [Dehalococcoidales bacterium]|nr:(Fe-S)-binding protein [Dehalococcoidales bacterium]
MTLAEYRQDMETCCRCSACKFIPFENVKGYQYVYSCPSIARYNFHAYSGSGRLGMGVALLENKLEYTDKLLEVVYNCQMCGACDISCKYAMDMEVLEPISAIRADCVEKGHTLPVLDRLAEGLRRSGRMVPPPPAGKGTWTEGLNLKDSTIEKAEVVFHAGCRTSADAELWKNARAAIRLMQKAGVDVAAAGSKEQCCGGRAYHMGYREDFLKNAAAYMARLKESGAVTLVTGCAECYQAFSVLYDRFKFKGGLEVLHTSQYFARLIGQGRLKPQKALEMEVTYHDPCHLGRLGEPWIHWEGRRRPGQIILFDPPKEFRRGTFGVYEPPREVLKSIPGIKLREMPRNREYAWCCGAGGGVKESNPGFAAWTAAERVREAESTGARAIVTACPGCESNLAGTISSGSSALKIYDVVELLEKATL